MTGNDKTSKTAEVVGRIVEAKGLGDFGFGIGLGLAGVAFCLMLPLMIFATSWDGHLHEQKQCYEIKKIDGELFKLNTCTGELETIDERSSE
ncbi:hypothetical protein [Halomonas elongata]|uniref:hypothetical protein n=1 Tax=Halomonas elongata TaxID=2746 RepID=UPI0023B025F3|nr:hypothetical protein [Halomonas elongata]